MRVSPAPLYNSFTDVAEFVSVLETAVIEVKSKGEAVAAPGILV